MSETGDASSVFGAATAWLEYAAGAIDLLSIAVLLIGAVRFTAWILRAEFSRSKEDRLVRMNAARRELGGYILAGLELLIVSDVIHTAITLELDGLIFLGGLVVIRSIISFFLEREIKELSRAQRPN
ncbi:DUF1622 domain-containing protein [Oricola cellulosilytica]|uniref:DUF1622 domain-containing protein n=1 Tax=Oricola cellulosilytica TaxID=1429082 RepID=A0A4R0PE54_9HYPH|nr:DUF1622 domain-containing protein [Oricola cellulosilytica]TCD14898.1 DUF1622 domain-containing protein [Oricola cellulosilytica]